MKAVNFATQNESLGGGPAVDLGTDQDVIDLPVFKGSREIIFCWRPSEEELEEINRTEMQKSKERIHREYRRDPTKTPGQLKYRLTGR